MTRQPRTNRQRKEKGSALIEFALCASLFWVPLLLGTIAVGFNLVEAIQVTQVCRDTAHMYSRGVVLSPGSSYQTLVVNLAPSLGLTVSGGNGAIVLSTVTYIDSSTCTTYNLSGSACTNLTYYVLTNRIVIGNSGLMTSSYGTPSSSILDSTTGNIKSSSSNVPYYLTDTSARVGTSFGSTGITLAGQQYAYVAEMYVNSVYWPYGGTGGVSSASIF